MHTFTRGSWASIYKKIIKRIYEQGQILGKSKTIDNLCFTIDPDQVFIIPEKRHWIWALVELYDRLNPDYKNPGKSHDFRYHWEKKLNAEGGEFCYNYHDLLKDPLQGVYHRLKSNKLAREAVATVYDPMHIVLYDKFPRVPCTLTLHFYSYPKDILNLTVNMRTNDVVNLLIYDVFHHSMLLRYMASLLDLKVGKYTHFASLAYYQKKREQRGYILKLLDSNISSYKFGNYNNKKFTLELAGIISDLQFNEPMPNIENDFLYDFQNLLRNQLLKEELKDLKLNFFNKVLKIKPEEDDE